MQSPRKGKVREVPVPFFNGLISEQSKQSDGQEN